MTRLGPAETLLARGRAIRSVTLSGQQLPTGGVLLAVHHTRLEDALAVRGAVQRAGRHVWAGLVLPTRAVPWGTSARTAALEHLGHGEVVVIFPEGERAPDEAVHKGSVEVAHLALEGGVPVCPAHLSQADGKLVVGEPLDFSRHARTRRSRAVLRAVTDEVMEAMSQLVGLPYRDVPARVARRELAVGRRERRAAARARRRDARQERRREQEDARAEKASQQEDLAQAEVIARRKARDHARRAALQDRLGEGPLQDPGEGH